MTGDKQHDATTEFNEALAAAFAANNFEALGPFFTEDASLLPPRGRLLEGRAAAAAFWGTVANRFNSVVFTTVAVKDLGPAARRETGSYAMAGGEGQPVEGKYVLVWQLVDGEWQIESGIWNRNGEAGGGRRQGQQGQPGQGQGQGRRGQGQGQGRQGGYRGGAGGGGGYRQGGGRPSFQGGAGGIGQGRGGGRQQGGGHGQGGGGSLYDGNTGLYGNPKD
ncbi:YybH family protein [Lichenibacterium dinghuense]|uniref:YybH family protein n=1 Tax=Lichenibacterium dinghuense TaxID=2895977 RepID=UPI001F2459DE|nr:nuclear transport factor 2 family protein [Lichenibacterium sp. 6Y81]